MGLGLQLRREGHMDDDTLFYLRDPHAEYTCGQIAEILKRAESMGYPLERGSYLESMTVKQVDRLTQQKYDA